MERVRTVAVVGRDAALWMAALALHKALRPSGVSVRAVELPPGLAPAEAIPAIPPLSALHELIELEEHKVLKAAAAVPMVAQRFRDWTSGHSFVTGYDNPSPAEGDVPFLQYWTKARIEGLQTPLEGFSLGATCARLGRVPQRPDISGQTATYGYHLDAHGYISLLKHLALRSGVEAETSYSLEPRLHDSGLAEVLLDDGRAVQADLFVDASGEDRLLIGRMPGAEFQSWREWLRCDRLLFASAKRLSPLPAFSEIVAFSSGWLGLYPLQNRTAVMASYDSSIVQDEAVAQQLDRVAGLRVAGEATGKSVRPGTQAQPWIANCVALGPAAICLDPLDGVQLHILHSGITHLISHFPVARRHMPEAAFYNRAMRRLAENIRDYQIAHYLLNARSGETWWDDFRGTSPPEGLQRMLALFQARGLLPEREQETFARSSWSAMLVGHGMLPRSYDPRLDRMALEEHVGLIQQRLRSVADWASAMTSTEDYVAHGTRARDRAGKERLPA